MPDTFGKVFARLMMVALVTATACGSGSGSSGGGTAGGPPDKAAVLKIGSLTAIPSLDPTQYASINYVSLYVFDRVLQLDSLGNVKPMLASSWSTATDGKSITLKLRKDVKFNDGTAVDAQAVKLNLDRNRAAKSASAPLLAGIDSVDVVDTGTVRVNLTSGGAQLLSSFGGFGGEVINPKCLDGKTDLNVPPANCGSGGLVVDRATPPNEWILKKAPQAYWDTEAFKFAGLEYHLVPATQTGFNGLQSGDLNIYQSLSDGLPQAASLQKQGVVEVKPFKTSTLYVVLLNPRVAPFNDPKLRQAVQAGMDTKAIADAAFAGQCTPGQQPVLPGGAWYDSSWNPNPFDANKAKQLLQQAGKPSGFSFSLTHTASSTNKAIAEIAQQQLSKVGITVTLDPVSSPNDPRVRQGNAQAFVASWGGSADPDGNLALLLDVAQQRLAPAMGTDQQAQIAKLRADAVDPRLSTADRAKIYEQVWKLVYQQAMLVNVCQLSVGWVHSPKVKNADDPALARFIAGADFRYAYVTK